MMWEATSEHVYPIGDLKPHVLTSDCWCRPFEDGDILVHNSMDKRELYERGELKPN